ncbi:MAG TPA: hypothetical protein VFN09_11940 [Rhodanobacteraceae bacterium]|nr:hypothetical protein [Rhodanobacteraceae bacterium]
MSRMHSIGFGARLGLAVVLAVAVTDACLAQSANRQLTHNANGWLRTVTPNGEIDSSNPFFQSLGSNGRSCASCHRQAEGWTLSVNEVRRRFAASGGRDPLFRPVDGAVSPLADVSSLAARRRAYAMLLTHAVIRIGLPMPVPAEFTLTAVDDPYGYASASELSLFRRPLPATNLMWVTGVMWDGRETFAPFQPPMDAAIHHAVLDASLTAQARDAILGHEQAGSAPDDATLARIVAFESHLVTAQDRDHGAGALYTDGAMAGARILQQQRFWVGINDSLGGDPAGAAFDAAAMRLFDDWRHITPRHRGDTQSAARAAISRGEQLFDSLPIDITGVAGLNDTTGKAVIHGTCSTCHNAPNIGNHSVGAPLDIGTADAAQRTPDMPLYTLTNTSTGEVVQSTDPGLAMLTGKWADIGKFKGPILRGVGAHPPYFHNGMAATLHDVVDYYDSRFNIGMSGQQKDDLVAFLKAL